MAIHYSSGFAKLYDKETEGNLSDIKYQLVETEPTQYTNKKWWGEFSMKYKLGRLGIYLIEFDDGRKSECVVTMNTEKEGESTSHNYYRFFGRGRLGKRI